MIQVVHTRQKYEAENIPYLAFCDKSFPSLGQVLFRREVFSRQYNVQNGHNIRYFIISFTVLGCHFDQHLSDPSPTLFSCSILFYFI